MNPSHSENNLEKYDLSRLSEEEKEKIRNYISLSTHYYNNAKKMLVKKEFNKAGEMLWGSVAVLIKAISLLYNKPANTHRDILERVKDLAKIEKNEELHKSFFQYVRHLHINYYESSIEPEDFPKYYDEVNKVLMILNQILTKLYKLRQEIDHDELKM